MRLHRGKICLFAVIAFMCSDSAGKIDFIVLELQLAMHRGMHNNLIIILEMYAMYAVLVAYCFCLCLRFESFPYGVEQYLSIRMQVFWTAVSL